MMYDIPTRVFLVKKFYELKSFTLAQRAYKAEFGKKHVPSLSCIRFMVSKFEKTGSVTYQPPNEKKITEKRKETKNKLENLMTEDSSLSTRKVASALGVSRSLILTVLHDDMHLKSYKYQQWHKLEEYDYKKRVEFAQWFLSLRPSSKFFFICSDEAYFYLSLPINKQNNRLWSNDRPVEGIEVGLHEKKVLVWCGISAKKIYGPFFFSESVDQHNYKDMLENYFWPKHFRTAEYKKYHFQQDGATPHTANAVQTWLTEKFGDKFLHKKMWPPRSPDLNPCDYYLWGHLKQYAYNPLPKTLDDLKQNIEREIKKISSTVLESVFENLEKRCNLVLSANGGHIELK